MKRLLSRLFRRPPPLPWRPFHPEPLKGGPAPYLSGQRENVQVRAIMEILETCISREADGLESTHRDALPRAVGMLEAFREAHRKIGKHVTEDRAAE